MSVSSVAVQLAQETLGDLSGRRVVVIGAGETGELTARALTERGVSSVFVANRHYDRAIGLAQRFGGHAVRFESLPAELEQADIVVSSTGSPHHIVERDELEAVMAARAGPAAAADRHRRAARHRPGRARDRGRPPARHRRPAAHGRATSCPAARPRRAAPRRCSSTSSSASSAGSGTLDVVPTIAALHERGEEIARQVLAENSGRWESLSEADRERLELVAATRS